MTIVTSCTSPTIGTVHPKKSCSMPTIAANRRMLAQLNAVRALHAPLSDNLLSNNAYMLITSLAWNLKALVRTVSSGTLRTQKGQAGRTETRTVDDGVSHVRQFPGARARPSRTNWPSIGGPSIGLERVAVCVPAIGRAAATAAPLLMPACRVRRGGRHSCRLFKTGIRKSPSAAAAEPRKETSNSSKPSRDPKIGHRHGRTVTFCAPRCRRPSDGKCEPAYACLRASGHKYKH